MIARRPHRPPSARNPGGCAVLTHPTSGRFPRRPDKRSASGNDRTPAASAATPRAAAGRALIPCNFECSGRRVPHDLADVVHSSGSAQPEPLGFPLWRGKHTGTLPGISGLPAPGHNGGTSSGAPMTPTLPIRRRTRSERCSTDRTARQLTATAPQRVVTPRNWRQVAERHADLPLWMIGTR